jgi:hypothetical protein
LKEPRLAVNHLLEERRCQRELESKESETKQPKTELTDRIDHWQQYLDDIQTVADNAAASKAQKAEAKLQVKDRRDDLLLGMNAKRALESKDKDKDEDENEDKDNNSNSNANLNTNSRLSHRSQRPALKRRCETPRQQSEVVVKVESIDKGLSKDDWKEILAASSSGEDLRKEVSSLQTTVH